LEDLVLAHIVSVYFKSESPWLIILNNINYFQWLSYMMDLLRSKVLYRIALGQESKPQDEYKQAK